MKLTITGETLTRDHFDTHDVVVQCTGPDAYTRRRKPIYPKGFTDLAEALWKRERLGMDSTWRTPIMAGVFSSEGC